MDVKRFGTPYFGVKREVRYQGGFAATLPPFKCKFTVAYTRCKWNWSRAYYYYLLYFCLFRWKSSDWRNLNQLISTQISTLEVIKYLLPLKEDKKMFLLGKRHLSYLMFLIYSMIFCRKYRSSRTDENVRQSLREISDLSVRKEASILLVGEHTSNLVKYSSFTIV